MHHREMPIFKIFSFFLAFTLISFGINTTKAQNTIYGNFPYSENFTSGLKPEDISIPESGYPSSTGIVNSATFNSYGLQLTPNSNHKFGAVFVNNRQFNSANGMLIEFEYSMYGGTDGGADGITFFLFDAAIQNPTVGAMGAGIGYAYNRTMMNSSSSSYRKKGLTGAYLGIALDSYGNFKTQRFQDDSFVNGIDWTNFSSINPKDHVSVRGAKGADLSSSSLFDDTYGMSDGYTGYPVLITQPTSESSTKNRNGVKLQDDGTYKAINNYTGNFSLRNGGYTTDPTNSNYRKALISLYPYKENGVTNGFLITVKIQHGTEITTVIDNYHYKTSFPYYENAIVDGGDYIGTSLWGAISKKYTLNAATPDFLRFGFSAATGAYNDYHIIRMLEVTLPSSAKANNDVASTTSGTSVSISALNNDLGYSGPIVQNQAGSNTYLNKTTFKFSKNNIDTANPYEYTEAGVGTWKYNSSTGIVTFAPLSTFVGTASINYSIKAGINNEMPYADEAYRSTPASITVEVTKPKNTHVISNRFIQPAIIK